LLDHEGPNFGYGASIPEHAPEVVREVLPEFPRADPAARRAPRSRRCVIRGRCLGGGLELAACCDVIFAARDAMFGAPEIKLGVFAPVASLVLPPRVGEGNARDLLLSGRTVGAAEALRMGLVQHVDDEPTSRRWRGCATHVLELSPVSMRSTSSRSAACRRAKRQARSLDSEAHRHRAQFQHVVAQPRQRRDVGLVVDVLDESHPERFRGADSAAGQQQVARVPLADARRKHQRGNRSKDAELDLGRAEHGIASGEDDVAARGKLEAAPETSPTDDAGDGNGEPDELAGSARGDSGSTSRTTSGRMLRDGRAVAEVRALVVEQRRDDSRGGPEAPQTTRRREPA